MFVTVALPDMTFLSINICFSVAFFKAHLDSLCNDHSCFLLLISPSACQNTTDNLFLDFIVALCFLCFLFRFWFAFYFFNALQFILLSAFDFLHLRPSQTHKVAASEGIWTFEKTHVCMFEKEAASLFLFFSSI